jgi:hypothetical protein
MRTLHHGLRFTACGLTGLTFSSTGGTEAGFYRFPEARNVEFFLDTWNGYFTRFSKEQITNKRITVVSVPAKSTAAFC